MENFIDEGIFNAILKNYEEHRIDCEPYDIFSYNGLNMHLPYFINLPSFFPCPIFQRRTHLFIFV